MGATFTSMPRVDVHTHIGDLDQAGALVEAMNAGGIIISISLSATSGHVRRAGEMHRRYGGRILLAPRNKQMDRGLWWDEQHLVWFRESGCAGTKIFAKYQRGIAAPEVSMKLRRQGELGLPVIGLHVADPPYGAWDDPSRQECIRDAESVIRANGGVTFIMAHGFWMMNSAEGLDTLAQYFDTYPNLNVDLSAVYQWWNRPEPSYDDLRAFIIRYADRILYGTDGNPQYTKPEYYRHTFRVLETGDDNLRGFFAGDGQGRPLRGLALPEGVLRRIYFANAARLIPRVSEALRGLGCLEYTHA